MALPLIPPAIEAIAVTTALVRQAALYLGKRAAEKLAKEGAKEALEVAAKKATNQGIKNMRAANKLGTNVAKKPKKEPLTMGARVKRAIKPLDAGNKKINNAIKKTATNDKTAIKFALGGAGLYAAANEVSNRVKGSDKTASKSKTPNKKPTTARGTPASNKPDAKKGLSPFEKAFSEARKDGRKTFPFKGDVYNTKLKTKVTPPTKKKK
jgi:hypothetical protein